MLTVMPKVRIGTIKHGEVGQIFDASSAIRLCSLLPDLAQGSSVLAIHLDRMHKVDCLEAGCANQQVELRLHVHGLAIVVFDFDSVAAYAVN